MNNQLRRELLQRHRASGFPGSIIDVYKAYDQGIDLIGQYEQQMAQQQQPQVAQTPEQQKQGLRPQHAAGNTDASMVFPNVPANQPFNTVGMKAPIDIKKFDKQGHLVKSYNSVPPGIQSLPMGPQKGTVLETPSQMQEGGFKPAPRMGVRQNPDKSVSTHKYATETLDGKNWFSFPTLFQNPDSSWVDMEGDDWYPAYEEALRRGEVLDFGEDKKGALEWGMGSWKDSMKSGGVRKYQQAGPLDASVTSPDWRATGPAMRIDGQIYQPSELTGGTRIMTNPETGDLLPVMLPAAEVVGDQDTSYLDNINRAVERSTGLLSQNIDQQQYQNVIDSAANARGQFANTALNAASDLQSAPQRYLVNAPLAYAKGQTPNLSLFPGADRSLGLESSNPAYPSETLGTENPWAAFAVDALTDPGAFMGLGAAGTRLGRRAAKLPEAAARLMNDPSSKLGRQLDRRRNLLIDSMYPSNAKDLGDVSVGSEKARNALRRNETIIGAEGTVRNPAFGMEKYRLRSSIPGEGNVRRAMVDRMMGRYPDLPNRLRLDSHSKSFHAAMRYPNPADGTPGSLENFTFIDDNKLAAGRAASELSSMIPKLDGEWLIDPGSLSGDSYPLWHNILNRKVPDSPQFTAQLSPGLYQTGTFNGLGKFSGLSQKLKNNNITLAESREILDMTKRIAEPTFQRYGITPPSNLGPLEYPLVRLHKQYEAGGVRKGAKKYITKKLPRR